MKRIVLFSPVFLLACPAPEDPSYNGQEFGRIAGYVTDVDGTNLDNVKVEAQDQVVLTDSNGRFEIDGVLPETDILLTFLKDGYAKGYSTTTIHSWETVSASGTLLEIDGYGVFDSSLGGLIEVGEMEVEFDANTIVDANGNAFNGEVTVAVAHLDPSTAEMAAGPGDLQALAFDQSGTSKDGLVANQLVSYGMIDVTLTSNDGDELNLAENSSAKIEMPITNGELANVYRTQPGETRQTWSFDPERRRWIEEGIGDVIQGDEEGELRFRFEATHFSWWNSDKGTIPTCASGRVVDYLGFPVRGAQISVNGGGSGSQATTDEDGYYVVSVLAGASSSFKARTHVAKRDWDSQRESVYVD